MRKKLQLLLTAVMAAALMVTVNLGVLPETGKAEAAETTLKNPRIVPDDSMRSGQKVTWDCVYFGSYPQTEIVSSDLEYIALDEGLRWDGDVIASNSVYNALQTASGWDSNNEVMLNGEKYKRIKRKDASVYFEHRSVACYNWADDTSWHYFKYEPIKWRVLHTDGNQALLLADVALDNQKYHPEIAEIYMSWEICTLRSWLNGYGAESNQQAIDYTRKNFINSAFTSGEQKAIADSFLENSNSILWEAEGGNNTIDKIFLLCESDIWKTDKAVSYGFIKDMETFICDEARRCQSSTYAKAMGLTGSTAAYSNNAFWGLRTPGRYSYYITTIVKDGGVNYYGSLAESYIGIRPALKLDLSYTNLYSYAGTVCSNEMLGNVVKKDGFYYRTLANDTLEIKGLDKDEESVIQIAIPEVINGKKVTQIGAYAFENFSELKSVEISGEIIVIGKDAFANSALESITIPENVKKISDGAFNSCYNLGSVTFSEGLESVGEDIFASNDDLTEIIIPASVTDMSPESFSGIYSLRHIEVASGNSVYESQDNVIFTKEKKELIKCMETKAGSYEVPLGVSSIGEKAFKECDDLTDIKISGNVARIGKEAFSQCSELRSISIPASVQYIDDAAFIWCGNLSSITILNKDCRIAEEALDNFDKDVEGGDLATIYGYKGSTAQAYAEKYGHKFIALDGNSGGNEQKVPTIQPPKDIPVIPAVKEIKKGEKKTVSGGTYTGLGNGKVAYAAPASKNIRKTTIPNQVEIDGKTYPITEINTGAFKNCKKLKSVVIGKGITSIGTKAFSGCKALKKITIKSAKLKKVGKNAFKGIHAKAVIKVPKAKLKAYKKLLKKKGQGKKVRIVK